MNNQKEKMAKEIIPQITADRLDAIIAENSYTMIDVRSPQGIETQGRIPGAINIPFDSIDKKIDKHHDEYNVIFNSEGPFLFCCTGGVMSYMAAIKAHEKGIKKVNNLEGGHSAWKKMKKVREEQ